MNRETRFSIDRAICFDTRIEIEKIAFKNSYFNMLPFDIIHGPIFEASMSIGHAYKVVEHER